jgi:Holliday junction resolvasome RuvABC endonuclease subunit
MRILAIDPSLVQTGICYYSTGYPADVVCGSICTTAKRSTTERVAEISRQIRGIIRTFDPHIIVIEEAVVGTGHGVQMGVLFLQGVIRNDIYRDHNNDSNSDGLEFPVVEMHSSRRRKYACGDQASRDKDQVLIKALEAAPPNCVRNNDEADAYWMARAVADAYMYDDKQESLTLYRREVLAAIDWPLVLGCGQPVWVMPKKPKKPKKL